MGGAMTMPQIVNTLSQLLGRTVTDKSGLTGNFDVRLKFAQESLPNPGVLGGPGGPTPPGTPVAPPGASDPTGPSIFTAIQEQLGLKLESARGPVDVLVIDGVEKPSEN
jgi:uncharacterized protein (TIGR03435 family)